MMFKNQSSYSLTSDFMEKPFCQHIGSSIYCIYSKIENDIITGEFFEPIHNAQTLSFPVQKSARYYITIDYYYMARGQEICLHPVQSPTNNIPLPGIV